MMNLRHSVKAIALAGLLSTALLLTGCFRIVEKVDFKSMQAGTYTMIIDLSTMNQLMKSSGQGEDREETERELREMADDLAEAIPLLEKVNGVSNLRTGYQLDEYSAFITFDFAAIQALNEGISALYSYQMELAEPKKDTYFETAGNRIKRTDNRDMIQYLRKDMEEDNEEAMQFFSEASFELRYTFPKKIQSVSNPEAAIEDNSREMVLKYFLFRPEFKDRPLGTTIAF